MTDVQQSPLTGWEHYTNAPAISISTLNAFSRCTRKYFYSFGIGIGKEEHLALKFGEAIHAALPSAFFGSHDEAMTCFLKVWETRDQFMDTKRNSLNASMMLKDYMSTHADGKSIYKLFKPTQDFTQVSDKISDYEVPFQVDIGLPIPLAGRIDALAIHRDTGKPWIIEWKTSSEMSARLLDGFCFSPQILCYTLVARMHNIEAVGGMVELLKVSSAKKDPHGTILQPIFVTDEKITKFLAWARYWGTELLKAEKERSFLANISACTTYPQHGSPGYLCEYSPLCEQPDWTSLKHMYVKKDYPTFRMLGLDQEGAD